ncbi:glucose-1-phosphate cytidylyltransferase [Alphaproteobacteria bacterium]|nr:glucose-1-phosphate cytidylyltransferase [Alphaproteobacteria bacterium]
MKVVILAGGFGTRISEYTEMLPKPMIDIGGRPIIWHIMQYYSQFGFDEFIIALGYKAEKIKEYFLSLRTLNSSFELDLGSGNVDLLPSSGTQCNWKISLVDTGHDTLTGGRVLRLKELIGDETFLLTYGDGLSNVDINQLVSFHKSHGRLLTLTAVRPNARFGELQIEGATVTSFTEKPQLEQGWINGGFFVVHPKFLDLIAGDHIMLEREPMEEAAGIGELMAFKHSGFWQCMDTKRDHDLLLKMWNDGAPWLGKYEK